MALTEKTMADLGPGRHADGRGVGLALLVRETGARLWVQRIRVGGRVRELGHGPWPRVSLTAARRAAADAKRDADKGADPLAAKREAKAALAARRTLREAMEGFLAAVGPAWRTPRTERSFRARVETYARPILDRRIAEIATDDVRRCIAPIWLSQPETAQRLRMHVEAIIDWAVAAGWHDGANVATFKRVAPLLAKPSVVAAANPVQHRPALPWRQVPAFVAALRRETSISARCLEFSILCASRGGEARKARWQDIDLATGVWTQPGEATKTGREHRVPLPAAALAVLAALPRHWATDAASYVFQGSRRDRPMSDMTLPELLRRMDAASVRAGGAGWRDDKGVIVVPHGFRSSFRDWAAETRQDRDLAEMSLAHAVGGAVERAYARSDLLDLRRGLMERWATLCDGAVEPRVVALRTVGR